ncbi:type II toxin-antitoxin system VapC family toxin [Leptospira koniambonensis]|uniref:Type II toxin-antitoxin system VapC family toxin n=1 Tax=Leptospira koniambonensis TaxID=2484950 RepID=A0A4R9J1M5_9LEPT|nr:type II toxin-antitoxin system VapC family toxin [Leptospira koniambonensis]TGL28265.1 type II toxin-antitoxin system VapC family toxin [Leptospira koniambonensis]
MRTILLDTQILLWFLLEDPKLPAIIKELCKEEDTRLLFHQVSLWEIQIKYDLGKLPLPEPPGNFLVTACIQSGLEKSNMQDEAIFFLTKLPNIHRDPFDRLLLSHAMVNGWEFATSDDILKKYPVRILENIKT